MLKSLRSAPGPGRQLSPMLGPRHVTRMRIQAALLKAAIDEGSSWHLAFEVSLQEGVKGPLIHDGMRDLILMTCTLDSPFGCRLFNQIGI